MTEQTEEKILDINEEALQARVVFIREKMLEWPRRHCESRCEASGTTSSPMSRGATLPRSAPFPAN